MSKHATVWTESFRVRSYETDPGGTASIQSICNYLQEAAGNHAAALGVSIAHFNEENLTWVLTRLRVVMDRFPAWKKEVTVETWPSGAERLLATREFVLRDADGVAGHATSAWLLIDRARRRPVRLPEEITSWILPDRERPLGAAPAQLPDVGDDAEECRIRVRFSDLDVNGHANNVRYAEWSVEGVPRAVLDAQCVRVLDLHFKAEGTYGDVVCVRTSELDPNGVYAHAIWSGDRELARARTEWRPR